MRILLLPSAYHPAIGGVEELTRRLAARLVDRGHQIEIWTFRHPPTLPPLDAVDGIVVRRFAFPLPLSRPASIAAFPQLAWRAYRRLSSAIRQFRPDVLHVQCFSAQGLYATALATRHRLPLVVSLQGETMMDDQDIFDHSLALRLGLCLALRKADAVTGCSAFVLEDARRRFRLPPEKGRVIFNGVEPAGDDRPQALDLPFTRFVLGLGRVVPKKGFDLLIDAFAKVPSAHPDVGLLVAGDGSAAEQLRIQTRALGLESRIALTGRLDRAQVAWAMAHAEVFVLPSRVEPFGIVVLEAMRAGRPVVVSACGGAPEIVRDGRDGLVVDVVDTAALSAAIDRLLGDPQLAEQLAASGQRRVEAFSWATIAEQYCSLYVSAQEACRN